MILLLDPCCKYSLPSRQFYEKGDTMAPGKKGISLNVDQFEALRDLIKAGHLDSAIAEVGNN